MGTLADQLRRAGLAPAEVVREPPRTLRDRLLEFDWSWEYSDQFSGRAARLQEELQKELRARRCPFRWEALQAWATGMRLQDFEEIGEGAYVRRDDSRSSRDVVRRRDLVAEEEVTAIEQWLNKTEQQQQQGKHQ